MAKIRKVSLSENYDKIKSDLTDKNHCATVALAAAVNRPGAEVQDLLYQLGRKKDRGTEFNIIEKVIAYYGFKRDRQDLDIFKARLPEPHRSILKNITTHHPRRFPGVFDPDATYLLFSRGHVSALVKGRLEDWAVNRALRVWMIWKITPTVAQAVESHMDRIHFNTGRKYSTHGQRIVAIYKDGVVSFMDHDRMIGGEFKLMPECKEELFTKEYVMSRYDAGEYQMSSRAMSGHEWK